MPGIPSAPLRASGRPRINRAASPTLALALPWLLVMLGSLAPLALPLIASAPVVPPVGFLLLVAWLQLRPGLLPVWAGLPLGLFDDLYSGQPPGSAVLLWSVAVIGIDYAEARYPWRSFAQDWLVAAGVIGAYLLAGVLLANLSGGATPVAVIAPQLIVSIFAYPLIARLVGRFDRMRLIPIRKV